MESNKHLSSASLKYIQRQTKVDVIPPNNEAQVLHPDNQAPRLTDKTSRMFLDKTRFSHNSSKLVSEIDGPNIDDLDLSFTEKNNEPEADFFFTKPQIHSDMNFASKPPGKKPRLDEELFSTQMFNESESFNRFTSPYQQSSSKSTQQHQTNAFKIKNSETEVSMSSWIDPSWMVVNQWLDTDKKQNERFKTFNIGNKRTPRFVTNFNSSIHSNVKDQTQVDMDQESLVQNIERSCWNQILNDVASKELDISQFPEMEESIMSQRISNNEKICVNSSYINRIPMKVSMQRIGQFYKLQLPVDWNAAVENDNCKSKNLMETSIDYLQSKLTELTNESVAVGSCSKEICEDEKSDFEEMRDSLKVMEKDFDSHESSIVSSTPKRNRSMDYTSQKEPSIEILPENDENRTKSILLNVPEIAIEEESISTPKSNEVDNICNSQANNIINYYSNVNQESDFIFTQILSNFDNKVETQKPNVPSSQPTQEESKADTLTADIEYLSEQNPTLATARRAAILTQIENIFKSLLESLVQQKPMELKIRTIRNWEDCIINDGVLSQKESSIITKSICFKNKASERTFTLTVILMCEIYKMLSRNMKSTRRELYYSDVDLFRNQESVNMAIETLCMMLNVQEYELGILSTSKGLIAGTLTVDFETDKMEYSAPQSVCQNPSAITAITTNADFLLIVEKETVFQRLWNDNILERFDSRIIMVTAKGYPDVNTRVFLKKFADLTGKPIYIIVDADPHGFEIMCTYKFGSMKKVHNSHHLAVPSIEWIGIHPTDIAIFEIAHIAMTTNELNKVDHLLKRPYLNENLRNELICLKENNFKAEIENVFPFSTNFFMNEYIPLKISLITVQP